jgi:hypothetical protein
MVDRPEQLLACIGSIETLNHNVVPERASGRRKLDRQAIPREIHNRGLGRLHPACAQTHTPWPVSSLGSSGTVAALRHVHGGGQAQSVPAIGWPVAEIASREEVATPVHAEAEEHLRTIGHCQVVDAKHEAVRVQRLDRGGLPP